MPTGNKLIVVLKGGLGNQLFSYSAARRLATVNSAELVIDSQSGFADDIRYRRAYSLRHFNIRARTATASERLEPMSRLRRRLNRSASRLLPFARRRYITQEGLALDRRLLELRFDGCRYIEGYWQSESYFEDIEPIIRDELKILTPFNHENQLMADVIHRFNSVGIHVRWFDDRSEDALSNCPLDYYQRAIAFVEQRLSDPHYFIFSDNPGKAVRTLTFPHDRVTAVDLNDGNDDAIGDLWLMSQCKHMIIANSTFSWWGAWLGKSPGQIVISPDLSMTGIGSWGFDGLVPDYWHSL